MDIPTRRDKKDRKGAGFWGGLAQKLGLESPLPCASGNPASLGLSGLGHGYGAVGAAGAAGPGLLAALLGNPAAVVGALTTLSVAVMLGVSGHGTFLARPHAPKLEPGFSMFPAQPK